MKKKKQIKKTGKWWKILIGVFAFVAVVAIVGIIVIAKLGAKENNPSSGESTVHTHEYTLIENKVATCETEGLKTYQCSCGTVIEIMLPKTPHISTLLSTENMINTYSCMSCGKQWTEACTHKSFDENGYCEICGAYNSIFTANVGDDVTFRNLALETNRVNDEDFMSQIVSIFKDDLENYTFTTEKSIEIYFSETEYLFFSYSINKTLNVCCLDFMVSSTVITGSPLAEVYWNAIVFSFGDSDAYDLEVDNYVPNYQMLSGFNFYIPNGYTVTTVNRSDNLDANFWKLVELFFETSAGGV